MKETFNDAMLSGNQQIITTTSGRNGYPENLKQAVIGFEDWKEMEAFIEANKGLSLYPIHLESKVGHDLWNRGNEATEDYNPAYDYIPDYESYTKAEFEARVDFDGNVVEPISKMLEEFEDGENLANARCRLLDEADELWREIQNLTDDQQILCQGLRSFMVMPIRSMEYEHDSTDYAIGVIERD